MGGSLQFCGWHHTSAQPSVTDVTVAVRRPQSWMWLIVGSAGGMSWWDVLSSVMDVAVWGDKLLGRTVLSHGCGCVWAAQGAEEA